MTIEAIVTLGSENVAGVGRDRIRLLQAVAREGSITAGAKAAGLSYKAAWDALDAMTNLFGQPLLETRTGGRAGGGASLTPAGLSVIEAFGRLEAEMARTSVRSNPPLQAAVSRPLTWSRVFSCEQARAMPFEVRSPPSNRTR
jgi:molybdate transport system regulatory protein